VKLQETIHSAQNKKDSNLSHCLLEILPAGTMRRVAMSLLSNSEEALTVTVWF